MVMDSHFASILLGSCLPLLSQCSRDLPGGDDYDLRNVMVVLADFGYVLLELPFAAFVSGVEEERGDAILCFAFEAADKDTLCEGVRLEIEHKEIQARCKNCKQNFDIKLSNPKCPECGSDDFELLPDAPLLLEEIEFETN